MVATTPTPAQAKALAETGCNEKGIELLVLQPDDLRG
jgi:hypothetical protein